MIVSTWSNVAVSVESALAAGVAITAISKANPGVASTATTPTAGEYVLLTVQGMHQVDGRVFRVGTVVPATSFQLEGENTTDYGTFTSGTYQTITFGTSVSTITGVTASGGEWEFDDVTTIHETQRSQIPTVASAMTFSMESIWDAADTGLAALEAASKLKDTRAVHIAFSNGQRVLFNGYVGLTMVPVGEAHRKVTTPLVFTVQRRLTRYAT